MKCKRILVLIILLLILKKISFSQNNEIVSDVIYNDYNVKLFAKFQEGNKFATDSSAEINTLIKLNDTPKWITYKKEREYKDDLGFIHKVYQQYYREYLIVGASYVLHEESEELKYANGFYAEIPEISLIPTISEDKILENMRDILTNDSRNKNLLIENKGFVICNDYVHKDNVYRLTYKILIQDDESQTFAYYYVDGHTGEILAIQNLICNINSNGTAQTNYSGTKSIVTDSYNTQYRLQENRQGVSIITLNKHNLDDISTVTSVDFIDNDNNWTTLEHPFDKYAHDAHWAAEKIFDYWKTVHNRNSIDNNGLRMLSQVHYKTNYNNASWNSHPDVLAVFYGDGDGVTYSNFATLDVCAHEFGHGIAQYTANFNLLTYESMAISEGFADIWGVVIENWAMPNSPPKNKWLIEEENKLTSPFYEIKIDNPNLINYGDTYNSGSYWGNNYRRMSTVLSYWFYLLAEGGGCVTSNDYGNNVYISSIGIDKAAKIAYRTLQLLNSSADFNMVRIMSIQAATELYGANSNELISVKNAWYAVGVGTDKYPYNLPTYSIYGPSVLCSSNPQGTFSINNLPSGASNVTWTTSYNLYVPNNGNNNTNPITIARVPSEPHVGGGVIWASFTVPYTYTIGTCTISGTTNYNLQKNITLTTTGGSANTVASIKRRCMSNANISQTCLEQGDINDFCIVTTSNPSNLIVTDVTWSVNNGASIIVPSGYSNVSIYIPSAGTYTVTAVITYNNCSVKTLTKTLTTGNCPCDVHWDDAARHSSNPIVPSLEDVYIEKKGLQEETKSIEIYPNPVNDDKLYVKLKDFAEDFYYKIISIDGRILDTKSKIQDNFINVKELPNGIYFLDILNNGEKSLHKFIINK